MVKVVTLFLVAIALLAMFGRLKFPGQDRLKAAKCSKCGQFKIGKRGCGCK